jgi:hypothetical protein
MRPLTLLVKCILKECNLHKVYTQGMSSWSVANMMTAHLMVSMARMCLSGHDMLAAVVSCYCWGWRSVWPCFTIYLPVAGSWRMANMLTARI